VFKLLLRGGLPLAVAFGVMVTPTYAIASSQTKILIKDECNPATFNAAVGPGTCIGNGAVTFAHFLNELQLLQRAPQWQFVPGQVQMNVGDTFVATNVGGETHTFTEVEQFGGGIVPFLNQAAGMTALAPECTSGGALDASGNFAFAHAALASIVPPGGSFSEMEEADEVGHANLYQCCIHPWMNATITVRP